MEYRNIKLKLDLPEEDLKTFMRVSEKLPLILQGIIVDGDKSVQANEDHLAKINISKDKRSDFIFNPMKGYRLRCFLDSFLVNYRGHKLPEMNVFPGWEYEQRPSFEISLLDLEKTRRNYLFTIFPHAIGD